MPGPRSTLTPSAMASLPSPSPTSSIRATSQLLQSVAEDGKHVAGTEGFKPRWSPSPACLRIPLGPSDIKIDGIPSRSKFQDSHSLFPERNAAFSSAVIRLTISACFINKVLSFIVAKNQCFHIRDRRQLFLLRCSPAWMAIFSVYRISAIAGRYSLSNAAGSHPRSMHRAKSQASLKYSSVFFLRSLRS